MAGAAGRVASAQSGVCRRNRGIDQNDPALRPMPARRAPRRPGSVGALEDDRLRRRAAAGRSRRPLRLRRPDERREVPRLGRAVPRSRPQARRFRHPRQSVEPQGRGRQNGDPRTPAPVSSTCRPTVPISTRSSNGSPSSKPCCAKPRREPSTPSSTPSPARSKPSPRTNAQTISQTQAIDANNENACLMTFRAEKARRGPLGEGGCPLPATRVGSGVR
jgi:hypothetical protein